MRRALVDEDLGRALLAERGTHALEHDIRLDEAGHGEIGKNAAVGAHERDPWQAADAVTTHQRVDFRRAFGGIDAHRHEPA